MAILSIQSHVAFGYVGNKAAVFPLQSMGHDVWPVNTVQFSNHTGYGEWRGEIFARDHIQSVIKGLEDLGLVNQCEAILSGYLGSSEIAHEVQDTVKHFKSIQPNLVYLCDPVIGSNSCFVKPEVLEFFRTQLSADIITPNQYEAEVLSDISIYNSNDLKSVAQYFHDRDIKTVVITGLKLPDISDQELYVFLSHEGQSNLVRAKEFPFKQPPNGTGDLFSALFLGSYLSTRDPVESLQRTVYFLDKVMQNTYDAKSRELQVISLHYSTVNPRELPEVIKL